MSTANERVRYRKSVDPVATDGRDVDTGIAMLEGEAAQQETRGEDQHLAEIVPSPWERVPGSRSIDIPIYYFRGSQIGDLLKRPDTLP